MNIKIVGIGDDGNKFVNRMLEKDASRRADCIAIGQRFKFDPPRAAMQIELYKGLLGLDGGTIERYENAAREARDEIAAAFDDADVIIFVADAGEAIGAGTAPIIAEYAHELGISTIAVVTRPFTFEGKRRRLQFENALERLKMLVDRVVLFESDELLQTVDPKTPMNRVLDILNDVMSRRIEEVLESIEPQ